MTVCHCTLAIIVLSFSCHCSSSGFMESDTECSTPERQWALSLCVCQGLLSETRAASALPAGWAVKQLSSTITAASYGRDSVIIGINNNRARVQSLWKTSAIQGNMVKVTWTCTKPVRESSIRNNWAWSVWMSRKSLQDYKANPARLSCRVQ